MKFNLYFDVWPGWTPDSGCRLPLIHGGDRSKSPGNKRYMVTIEISDSESCDVDETLGTIRATAVNTDE